MYHSHRTDLYSTIICKWSVSFAGKIRKHILYKI
jgi:hypothetical protein